MTMGVLQRARVASPLGVTQLLGRGSEPRSPPEKPNQQKTEEPVLRPALPWFICSPNGIRIRVFTVRG